MTIPPFAKLFFPCADLQWASNQSVRIIDPVPRLTITQVSPRNPRIDFFVMITGGLGKINLSIQGSYEGLVLGSKAIGPLAFDVKNRADIVITSATLENLKFRRSGIYEFQLLANHVAIARWELPVLVDATNG